LIGEKKEFTGYFTWDKFAESILGNRRGNYVLIAQELYIQIVNLFFELHARQAPWGCDWT
jgi:hypothetical protein